MAAQVDDGLAQDRRDRQREQRADDPVDLAAEQQREDHEQRVDAQRVAEDLRRDDVALDLLQARRTAAPTQTAVSGSWKSATRIGGSAPRNGPTYGISSISPKKTPKASA